MKNAKIFFTITAFFIGAFLLFSPQTSQAVYCKCTVNLGGNPVEMGCEYRVPRGYIVDDSPSQKTCNEYKTALITEGGSAFDEGAFGDGSESLLFNNENLTCEAFTDSSCSTPLEAPPSDLEVLQTELTGRKPILEINFPGLNFSDVRSSTNETGTYFYIAWIPELILALYKFLLAVVSIVAAVVIVIQGVRVIGSGGGEGTAAAYKKIFQAVVGLFIAWGSYAILYNINPALVEFNSLKVKVVEGVPYQGFVGEEDGEHMEDLDFGAAEEPAVGTKFAFCTTGESKCNDKCVEFFQQPAVCPIAARLSSPLKVGKIRCNYHIVDPKSEKGAGYDINATYNLDLPAAIKTNLYAPIDGEAIYKTKNGNCGNGINLTFKENNKSYTLSMCHLWDSVLEEGKKTKVVRGQLIGRTGGACCNGDKNGTTNGCRFDSPSCQDGKSTGRSSAPHLHIGSKNTFPILPCIEL